MTQTISTVTPLYTIQLFQLIEVTHPLQPGLLLDLLLHLIQILRKASRVDLDLDFEGAIDPFLIDHFNNVLADHTLSHVLATSRVELMPAVIVY